MKRQAQLTTDDLHTCPDCGQTGFSARGLKAHQGNKTCRARAAEPAPAAEAHIARFKVFHGMACKSALELKLAKYFAGLEVNALCDLHAELHGETRGQFSEKSKTERLSVLVGERQNLEAFLEEKLGVTARTARTYRAFFRSTALEAPQIADKLNGWWQAQALPADASAAKGAASSALAPASLQTLCATHAETIQALALAPDEFGLHELFQTPEGRDVTPPKADDPREKAKAAAIVEFWSRHFIRRLHNQELHRLPANILEAVTTEMEDAAKRAREVLTQRQAKKKPRK